MKTTRYEVDFDEKAGRLELFIRFFWMIPACIVAGILGFIAFFAYGLQFLHILFLGKKHRLLHNLLFKCMAYYTKVNTYAALLTDERSPIMPED